jgi:hypothetical protein
MEILEARVGFETESVTESAQLTDFVDREKR